MKKHLYNTLCSILRFFTRLYLWRTKPYVIGVTGSVGKTTCRTVITEVLIQLQLSPNPPAGCGKGNKLPLTEGAGGGRSIYTSPKNFNSELGLIFSFFCIEDYTPGIKNLLFLTLRIIKESLFSRKKYDIIVAEYGIDSPGNMDFLLSVRRPDIGIITRLDSVHSVNFPGGREEYWQDKRKLLLASKDSTFYPEDDSFLAAEKEYYRNTETIFGEKLKTDLRYNDGEIVQSFVFQKKNISLNSVSEENVEYVRLALRIASQLSFSLKEVNYHFEFHEQAGRFSLYEKGKNLLIDSTYNASPKSMEQTIQNTKKIQEHIFPEKKMLLVLGDMRELGDFTEDAHKGLYHYAKDVAGIFTVGPEMYQYLIPEFRNNNFSGELHSSLSSREIGARLNKFLKEHPDDSYIILFKGSQNTIFTEEALAIFLTPTERKKLVRQSEDWIQKKEKFFMNL